MTVDPVLGPNAGLVGVLGSRERLETPALVLDLDALEHNIADLAGHAAGNGYKLRPVAKIHKSVEIARRQVAAGAIGQCCATLAEAEVMAVAGIPGVFLFTSVVTPGKIARLVRLASEVKDFLLAVDDAGNVEAIGDAARAAGTRRAWCSTSRGLASQPTMRSSRRSTGASGWSASISTGS